MPSKSKAKLAQDVELQGKDIRDLQTSHREIHKYLEILNGHITVVTNAQERLVKNQKDLASEVTVLMEQQLQIGDLVNNHTEHLDLISDELDKVHEILVQPHEDKDLSDTQFNSHSESISERLKRITDEMSKHEDEDLSDTQSNSKAPSGLGRMRPGGNVSDLTATEQREHGTMIAATNEEDHERHAKPIGDRSARSASKMTNSKRNEDIALEDDEHPVIEAATEDDWQTSEGDKDTASESDMEVPSKKRDSGDFHYQHDLADISTTLAVAPPRQSEPDLGLPPPIVRRRERVDRYVRVAVPCPHAAIPELTVMQRVPPQAAEDQLRQVWRPDPQHPQAQARACACGRRRLQYSPPCQGHLGCLALGIGHVVAWTGRIGGWIYLDHP